MVSLCKERKTGGRWFLQLLCLATVIWLANDTVAEAQDCSADDIFLSSQEEVDDFQLDHGPCDFVVGNLRIEGANITGLAGLSALTAVAGSLEVFFTDSLLNFELPSLTSVDGAIWLVASGNISTFELPNLESVGSLLVSDLQNISLIEFPKLEVATAAVSIGDTGSLKEINFPSLQRADQSFSVTNNPLLERLAAPALETVGSSPIGSGIFISNNRHLTSLEFPRLHSTISLAIQSHERLTSVSTPLLSEARVLQIISNFSLESFEVSVEELERLDVSNNVKLIELDTSRLTEAETISLFQNTSLETLDLPLLQHVTRGFSVRFNGIWRLHAPNLEEIDDHFFLEGNSHLTDLDLSSLAVVGGYFLVHESASLPGLALPSLTEAGSVLSITNNDSLLELSFPNLQSLGLDLVVEDNGALGTCCGLLPVFQPGVVNGEIRLAGNATGCNSPEEIDEQCAALVVEIPTSSTLGLGLLVIGLSWLAIRRLYRTEDATSAP